MESHRTCSCFALAAALADAPALALALAPALALTPALALIILLSCSYCALRVFGAIETLPLIENRFFKGQGWLREDSPQRVSYYKGLFDQRGKRFRDRPESLWIILALGFGRGCSAFFC